MRSEKKSVDLRKRNEKEIYIPASDRSIIDVRGTYNMPAVAGDKINRNRYILARRCRSRAINRGIAYVSNIDHRICRPDTYKYVKTMRVLYVCII